jgi:KUP system potassium uptake protein
MIATIGLVLGFQSSGNLSSAYGLAVSLDMVFTTLLAALVAIRWGWHPAIVGLLAAFFLVIDLAFFGANSLKFVEGGWYPVTLAVILFIVMTTWRRGRLILHDQLETSDETLDEAFDRSAHEGLPRVPGTAVFVAAQWQGALSRWSHHVSLNRVLHEHIVFLSVRTLGEPRVGTADRLEIKDLGHGAWRVIVRYGYMQSPDLPVALRLCERAGMAIDLDDMIYFTGRVTVVPVKGRGGMMRWRQALFAFLNRNSVRQADYLRLPPDRVLEIGMRIEV